MSLRVRLIVVFFLLSVVPLGAVTFYSYTSNVRAVQDAAARESDLLAGELSQRMQLVTSQLSERVEHLVDLQNESARAQAAQVAQATPAKTPVPDKTRATKPTIPATPTTPAVTAPASGVTAADAAKTAMEQEYGAQVAQTLGEAAMLLNNVELRGLGRGNYGLQPGGRRGMPPPTPPGSPGSPGPLTPPSGAGPTPPPTQVAGVPPPSGYSTAGRGTPNRFDDRPPKQGGRQGTQSTPPSQPAQRAQPDEHPMPQWRYGDPRGAGSGTSTSAPSGTGQRAGGQGANATVPTGQADAATPDTNPTHLTIDLAPVRREILKQIVPDGQLEHLTPEERQRVARELNQRMLGIAQGLQLGAAGLQKRAADAERAAGAERETADTTARSAETSRKIADAAAATIKSEAPGAATPSPAPPASNAAAPAANHAPPAAPRPPAPVKKKTEVTGTHLGVMVEQNGQVVEQVGAEMNMPQVLATVFSTTRRDRGEVPFAISKDGKIFTPTDDDKKAIEALKLPAPTDGQATSTVTRGDWIVVTNADPSGSGLRFGIAKPVGDSLSDLRKTAARNASFGLGFIALALVGIVPLSGRLTRNLSKLTDGVDRISHGDYSVRVPLTTKDEIGRLATAFNRMASDVEQHQRAAVGQERVKRELELGRQIQHEMLPHEPLRLGLTEIKGVSVPAREVGGDFFNYFELSDHRIALLVGDVSGKGVGAALLMANIQASLRTRLALGQELAAIADATDRDVAENSPAPVYATLFLGILDPASRTLQYVNAGHHPQYALCQDGLKRMSSSGLPVGLLAGRGYTASKIQLSAGDVLFFYTDGCVEAENAAGDMFGPERLEAVLTSSVAASSEEILQRVEGVVKAFRGSVEPGDDETMMAVKVG